MNTFDFIQWELFDFTIQAPGNQAYDWLATKNERSVALVTKSGTCGYEDVSKCNADVAIYLRA